MKIFNEQNAFCAYIGLLILLYSLWAIGSEVPNPVGTTEYLFAIPVQTDPGAHPASTIGTGAFSWG
jgi:hypothetical protein